MPTWRCPHCGTPQAETARCWVCHRSTTSCRTCLNFRQAVFGGLGYCGLDRRRTLLAGDDVRACWSARTTLIAEAVAVAPSAERPFSGPDLDAAPIAVDPPAGFWLDTEG
jgi:hypothetical protein